MKSYKKLLIASLLLIIPSISTPQYKSHDLTKEIITGVKYLALYNELKWTLSYPTINNVTNLITEPRVMIYGAIAYCVYSQYQQNNESKIEFEPTSK